MFGKLLFLEQNFPIFSSMCVWVLLFSSFHSSFFYHAKIRISKNKPNNKTICRIETFASKCHMQKLSHCCYFVLVSRLFVVQNFSVYFFARKRSIQQPKKRKTKNNEYKSSAKSERFWTFFFGFSSSSFFRAR